MFLTAVKFKNPWLVQLATGENRRVMAKVNNCPLKLAGQLVVLDLNVLPKGLYDVLIGIDWLEKCWSLINYKDKTINYVNEEGIREEIQGIQRPLKLRPVTTSEFTKCIQKGCQIYAIQVGYSNSKENNVTLKNIPVVQNFMDVFPEKIMGLPLKRDTDFTIELIPGVVLVSQAPYRMSVLELIELKM